MPKNSFTTEIFASQQKVWEIMTNHESYAKWSPAKKVTLERQGEPDKNGKGAIRVFHSGLKVREEVIGWDPPNSMTYHLLAKWPIRNYESTMTLSSGTLSSKGNDDESNKDTTEVTQLLWESKWENRLPSFLAKLPVNILRRALHKFAQGIKSAAEVSSD